MKRHFLQSRDWEKYENLEGRKTLRVTGEGFEAMAVVHETPVGKYLYCPYGPSLEANKPKEALKRALDSLVEVAKEQGAFFVRIEPTMEFTEETMTELGLKKSHDLDPAHTWVLDLTKPDEDIINGIEKRKVRHWRNHEKKGMSIRQTQNPEEITILTNLLNNLGDQRKFSPQSEEHLKNQLKSGFATLYVIELEGEPIAAALVYDHDGVRYYAHAATDDEHRKLMAGTILLIQMILDAHQQGAKVYDFWGITTSEDPQHPWYGFTQYKKSFGGRQVDYAGTWDLPIKKAKYKEYQVLRKVNRIRRKV